MPATITKVDLLGANTVQVVPFAAAAVVGWVVLDKADSNRWKQSDSNASAVLAGQDGYGLLLHDVSTADRHGVVVTSGTVFIDTLGVAAKGKTWILGAVTPGDMAEDSEAASGWFKTVVGIGGTEGASDTVDEMLIVPWPQGYSGKAIA